MQSLNPRSIIGMQINNTNTWVLSDMVAKKTIHDFLIIFISQTVVLSRGWDCHIVGCIIQ